MPSLAFNLSLLAAFAMLAGMPLVYVPVRTCLEPGPGRHRRGGGRHAARWSAR